MCSHVDSCVNCVIFICLVIFVLRVQILLFNSCADHLKRECTLLLALHYTYRVKKESVGVAFDQVLKQDISDQQQK